MANTTSIAMMSINEVSVSDIVNEVISDKDLAELAKKSTKETLVASQGKKAGMYGLVDINIMNYFVDAYNRVKNLSTKTAWAEREVIVTTMDSEYYKKAFASDKAYAEEIGQSESQLSKIKRSVEVRDDLERITGMKGFAPSFVDEILPCKKKYKESFALFINYSGITPTTTVKALREMRNHYEAVVNGEERPTRKGFFGDTETQQEYEERIAREKAERISQQEESQQEESQQEESQQEESQQEESQQEKSQQEESQQEESQQEESQQEKTTLAEIAKLAEQTAEGLKNMTITMKAKKRGVQPKTLEIGSKNTEIMADIIMVLIDRGIITLE